MNRLDNLQSHFAEPPYYMRLGLMNQAVERPEATTREDAFGNCPVFRSSYVYRDHAEWRKQVRDAVRADVVRALIAPRGGAHRIFPDWVDRYARGERLSRKELARVRLVIPWLLRAANARREDILRCRRKAAAPQDAIDVKITRRPTCDPRRAPHKVARPALLAQARCTDLEPAIAGVFAAPIRRRRRPKRKRTAPRRRRP